MKRDDVFLTREDRRQLFERQLRKSGRFEDALIEAQVKKLVEYCEGNDILAHRRLGSTPFCVSDCPACELKKLAHVN